MKSIKHIIYEAVSRRLNEYASYNENVGILAKKYRDMLVETYTDLSKGDELIYDDIKWGFGPENYGIINKVNSIVWGKLEKPKIYGILVGPFKEFGLNLHITACIIDCDNEFEGEYNGILRSNIHGKGSVLVYKNKEKVIMNIAVTSKVLYSLEFLSLISHELLHVSQLTIKYDRDGFFDRYDYKTNKFFVYLRQKARDSKSPLIKGNERLDMLFYILEETEQNAFLHEVAEEMRQSGESSTYGMLKTFTSYFLNMKGLFTLEQYLSMVILQLYGRNKTSVVKRIINELKKFDSKLSKVYYQNKRVR